MPLIIPANSITGGFEVANSLRFDNVSNDYLERTPSSTGNKQIWTYSTWIKRCKLGAYQTFLSSQHPSDTSDSDMIRFTNSDTLQFFLSGASSSNIITTQVFRDTSAWYHIVFAVDTTQSTSSNRVKYYVNGSQITSFGTETYPSQNYNTYYNTSGQRITILSGAQSSQSGDTDAYLSEVCFIDGQQLDPTSFGEFDEDTGIWKPIDVSGLTFGTNGFYLNFENSGSLGADVSGNGNNFTVNNLTSIDQTTDTPTNNFATFNPLINNWTSISQGNLKVTNTIQAYRDVFSTIAVTSGKWYVECRIDTERGGTYPIFGIADASEYQYPAQYNLLGRSPLGWGFQTDGNYYNNNADAGNWSTLDSGDIIGFYLDLDSAQNTLKVYKNGVSELSINISNPVDGYYFCCSTFGEDSVSGSINFGNPIYTLTSANSDANGYGSFEYSPTISSVNYYALNTKNLAEYG